MWAVQIAISYDTSIEPANLSTRRQLHVLLKTRGARNFKCYVRARGSKYCDVLPGNASIIIGLWILCSVYWINRQAEFTNNYYTHNLAVNTLH
jgi:hypothetical protein